MRRAPGSRIALPRHNARRTAVAGLTLTCAVATFAQTSSATNAQTPFTVSGTVVNGLNGAPLPRALVRIDGRAVLTDPRGRFSFPQFTGSASSAVVTRPGFSPGPNGLDGLNTQIIADLSQPVELKMYPDALVTGTVTGSDHLPLSRIQVLLYRQTFNENGTRTIPVGFGQTDSHGAFRFLEPAGRYRIAVSFSQRPDVEGDVVLPVDYPEATGTEAPPTFTVRPGEERRIDLHPRTSVSYPVDFEAEIAGSRVSPRVEIKAATGAAFSLFARGTSTPGHFQLNLPSGTYLIRVTLQEREAPRQATVRITVAGRPLSGLVLHLTPEPSIPVEIQLDTDAGTAAASTQTSSAGALQPPTPQSFNLRLQNLFYGGQFWVNEVNLQGGPGQPAVFQASDGTYRLRGQAAGTWYVRSATYGGTDLLTQPLVVSPGAGGESIRLLVSDQTGQVSGKITGADTNSSGYVYFVAKQPNLSPVALVRVGSSGTFERTLPPGAYTAVAFDGRFPGDLTDTADPRIAGRLSAGADITVTAGGKSSADLTLQAVGDDL